MLFNSSILLISFVLFITLIVILNSQKQWHLKGRAWSLFRVFFPSWRFFEDVGSIAELSYRTRMPDGSYSKWVPALSGHQRNWTTLVFNPQGNLKMACQSLIEQTVLDINDLDSKDHSFDSSVSYQLVRNLVEFQIRQNKQKAPLVFEFKIEVQNPNEKTYTALYSEEHTI